MALDADDIKRITPIFQEMLREGCIVAATVAVGEFKWAVLNLIDDERERYAFRARVTGSREAEAVVNVLTRLAERVQTLVPSGNEGGGK